MRKKPIIKINNKEFQLKITLGFWKDLSFKRSDFMSVRDDAEKIIECLKIAIFYGNRKKFGWNNLKEMEKDVSQKELEDLEEDPYDLIDGALYYYMPEQLKKKLEKIEAEELEGDIKKK